MQAEVQTISFENSCNTLVYQSLSPVFCKEIVIKKYEKKKNEVQKWKGESEKSSIRLDPIEMNQNQGVQQIVA